MKHLLKLFFVVLTATISLTGYAADKDEITLTVTSDGKTKDEAIKNALRTAVEQTYGVFVSANTDILNEELVKDEIATVSSGNIKKFNELAYSIVDGQHIVTLYVTVNRGKLISYTISKGGECELDGASLFADIELQTLYKQNEEKLFTNLISEIEPLFRKGYDYKLELNQSRKLSNAIEFECKITAILNENGALAWRKLLEALKLVGKKDYSKSFSLFPSSHELEKYPEFVHSIKIYDGSTSYNGSDLHSDTYLLRSPISAGRIHQLLENIPEIRKDVSIIIGEDSIDISNQLSYYKTYHETSDPVTVRYNMACPYRKKKGSDCGQFKYMLNIPLESLKAIKNIKVESND